VTRVLTLLANFYTSPMGAVMGHNVARWVYDGLAVHDALCQKVVTIEEVCDVFTCVP
jgi:hypothetical protein